MKFHPEILNSQQLKTIEKLGFLKKREVYLAGGTALALQIDHRSSIDKVNFKTLELASVEDIAAMKIAAIIQRGKRRDFIDLYFLLKKYRLSKLIKLAIEKYSGYQPMLILRALIYFEDAEKEDIGRGIQVFDKNFSWERAKEEIFKQVKEYQLAMFH